MSLASAQAMLKAWFRDEVLQRMLKNISYLVGGTASASLLGLVTLALTARALGPEMLGILALIQAYNRLIDRARVECWQALIKYGADALENQRYDEFKSLLKFGVLVDVVGALVAAAIAAVGVYIAGWWLDWAPETTQMASLFSVVILFRISSMPTAVLRLFDRFGIVAWQQVAVAALRLLLTAVAYVAGAGLWAFVLITMGTQIFGSVILIVSGWRVLAREGYRKILSSSCKGITQRCPGIWGFIWSLNAGNIARRSTRELDILFVGAVLDPAAASLYHIAKKLGEILVLAGTPIQQAVYPELARLWARAEAARFRRTVTQIDLSSGGLGVAFMMVMAFNAELLISLTMGAQFTAAAGPLVFQTLGVVVFLFGTALRPALFSMGMQVRFLQIVTLSTVCFYATLLIAVPSFGIYGAPIAHIIYNLVWLIAMRAAFGEGIRQGPAVAAGAALAEEAPSRSA
jgi:O-antigen/teichoic acid export membrane protein